jgi:A/G-specific adenine glycosylase
VPQLLKELKKFYKTDARAHLPWRATHDPYRILVSEVMLQQTQVERVIPYYGRWMKQFPTARVLAMAPLSRVLRAWQGLGYNRRGKYLWEAGKMLSSAEDPGQLSTDFLESLPGVGHYTARAVAAFAYNRPEAFVETNIRTVFFHHLETEEPMSDKELLPLVAAALKKSKMEPRDFYAALMDYGSHLKRQGVRLNAKSRHYKKQSRFEGSARQKRAAELRELLAKGASEARIRKALDSK